MCVPAEPSLPYVCTNSHQLDAPGTLPRHHLDLLCGDHRQDEQPLILGGQQACSHGSIPGQARGDGSDNHSIIRRLWLVDFNVYRDTA